MRINIPQAVLVLYFFALIATLFSTSLLIKLYYHSQEELGDEEAMVLRTTGATQSSSGRSTLGPAAKNHSFMIVDCIMYNGEPIVPYRLEILYDVVDRFYITEGTVTISNMRKSTLFKDMQSDVFKPYQDKIVWNIVEPPRMRRHRYYLPIWKNEKYMRNNITERLKRDSKQGALPKDFVIINTDSDEIPDPKIVEQFKPGNSLHSTVMENPTSLHMAFFYYNFNWYLDVWTKGHTLPGRQVVEEKYDLEKQRHWEMNNLSMNHLDNSGWHLSFGTNVEGIVRKLESFAHQEFNTPFYTNRTRIQDCIENGIDLFLRNDTVLSHFDYRKLPLSLQKFHENVCKMQQVNPQSGERLATGVV